MRIERMTARRMVLYALIGGGIAILAFSASGCSSNGNAGGNTSGATAQTTQGAAPGKVTLPAPAQRTPDPVDPDEKSAPNGTSR